MLSNDVVQTSWALVAAVVFFLTLPALVLPRRLRLRASLIGMGIVLTVGKLQDFEAIALAAKIASGWSFVLIALAAFGHPGPRRKGRFLNLLSLLVALLACFLVLGAEDHVKAVVLRTQMLVVTLAMFLVSRTIVDHRSLRERLIGIFIGVAIGSALSLSRLLIDPVAPFQSYGRLQPYGCNPVQIGVLYLVVSALGVYFSMEPHRCLPRSVTILLTSLSVLGATLTVSRMAVIGIIIVSLPTLARLIRRPVAAVVVASVIIFFLPRLFTGLGDANLDHIDASQDSHRIAYMKDVLAEVSQRPLFGLLYSENVSAHNGDFNAHNAYIEMLFLGGITFTLPSVFLLMIAAWGSVRSLHPPNDHSPFSPLLAQTLVAFYWLTLACGGITFICNYPTFTISALHCLLIQHFLILAGNPQSKTSASPGKIQALLHRRRAIVSLQNNRRTVSRISSRPHTG